MDHEVWSKAFIPERPANQKLQECPQVNCIWTPKVQHIEFILLAPGGGVTINPISNLWSLMWNPEVTLQYMLPCCVGLFGHLHHTLYFDSAKHCFKLLQYTQRSNFLICSLFLIPIIRYMCYNLMCNQGQMTTTYLYKGDVVQTGTV